MFETEYRVDERTIDGMTKFVAQKKSPSTFYRWVDIDVPVNYRTEAEVFITLERGLGS